MIDEAEGKEKSKHYLCFDKQGSQEIFLRFSRSVFKKK